MRLDQTWAVEVTHRVNAPPAEVFTYFVDADKHQMWQGIEAELDPRPGGIYRVMTAPGVWIAGEYVVLDPPNRLVLKWGFESERELPRGLGQVPAGSSTVEFTFEPDGDGTNVRVRHLGLPSEESSWAHEQGWNAYLPRLVGAHERGDPEADPTAALGATLFAWDYVRSPEEQARRGAELRRAVAALNEVTPRLTSILRAAEHPDARAIGDWTIAEVAMHLAHVAEGERFLARNAGQPAPKDLPVGDDILEVAASFNASLLAEDPQRDLAAIADRLERGVAAFEETMAKLSGSEPVTWLGGAVVPSSALACHLLEELLVHGRDVAQADGKGWPIEREHAVLAHGFVLDLVRFSGPEKRRAFVHQEAVPAGRICYELRLRGAGRNYLTFEDGILTVSDSAQNVDCRISAEPVTALLLTMGRIGPVAPILTGKLTAWGRRPWLGLRLIKMLRNP